MNIDDYRVLIVSDCHNLDKLTEGLYSSSWARARSEGVEEQPSIGDYDLIFVDTRKGQLGMKFLSSFVRFEKKYYRRGNVYGLYNREEDTCERGFDIAKTGAAGIAEIPLTHKKIIAILEKRLNP